MVWRRYASKLSLKLALFCSTGFPNYSLNHYSYCGGIKITFLRNVLLRPLG